MPEPWLPARLEPIFRRKNLRLSYRYCLSVPFGVIETVTLEARVV